MGGFVSFFGHAIPINYEIIGFEMIRAIWWQTWTINEKSQVENFHSQFIRIQCFERAYVSITAFI